MNREQWNEAREAEIEKLAPLLVCRAIVDDVPPGQPEPCNALTPMMVKNMLHQRRASAAGGSESRTPTCSRCCRRFGWSRDPARRVAAHDLRQRLRGCSATLLP